MAFIEKDDFDINEFSAVERRKRMRRNYKMASILLIAGFVMAFILIMIICIVLFLRIDGSHQKEQETMVNSQVPIMYTQEEMEAKVLLSAQTERQKVLDQLAEGLNSGKTIVETLRTLYTDNIVVASNGKYHFIPISDKLKKHNYRTENLLISDREIAYAENGKTISHKGIDVSKYNGVIDWRQVAEDGVEFAFIRVGIRGYGAEGRLVEDEGFEENVENALSSGIKVGVYFFTQATTVEEAVEEAEFVKQIIAPYRIECPVVLDVEKVSDSEGRMNKISKEERTRVVKTFCEEISKAGYTPMLYYNMEMGALMLDLEQLEDYDKWFAYYNKDIYYPYDFKVWQYSDKGRVSGINGDVDLNIAFEKIWE